jgi:hypothetical protein
LIHKILNLALDILHVPICAIVPGRGHFVVSGMGAVKAYDPKSAVRLRTGDAAMNNSVYVPAFLALVFVVLRQAHIPAKMHATADNGARIAPVGKALFIPL